MDQYYFYTEGLTVGYHGVPLVKEIGIGLKRGEIVTLIGPNGAGKTTILKSIIRQLEPVGGAVYLDGRNIKEFPGRDLSKSMSVVLTERTRPELMTCEDVVAAGRYPYTGRFGVLSGEDKRIVRESMELVHVRELSDQDFSTASDGQKQRVMLARAICQQPEMIVLDEPTSFLDIKYKLEFLSVLQKLARTGRLAVIMSLHELDLAERISDKVVCIKGDKVDRFGSPREVFTPGYIRELFDIGSGSYDEETGCLELETPKGEPEVFVIAGNGSGAHTFRKLQRAGIPFAAGILWENDLDYPAARALAAEVVSESAFCPISTEHVKRAEELISKCRKVVCTVDLHRPGEFADALRGLWEYAKSTGKAGTV